MNNKKMRKIKKKTIWAFLFSLAVLFFFWFTPHQAFVQPEQSKPAELYSNQTYDDLRQIFVSGISNSQKSVLLIIYALNDPYVMKALKQAGQRGVQVDVIFDPKASPGVSRRLGSNVRLHKRFSSGLMHQKILVVDDSKIWIGSANMTGDSLRSHGNLVAGFHSREMARTIALKALSLINEEKCSLIPHCHYTIGGQRIELSFFPEDKQGAQRLLQLIRSAQKTIKVAMFTWTREDLAQAILEAQKRGVKTEVAIDYHTCKGASAPILQILKDGGMLPLLGQKNSLLHHKFIYIDGKTLVNGSANWTKAAFTKNDDCFIIIHDLNFEQQKKMETLWEAIKADSVVE